MRAICTMTLFSLASVVALPWNGIPMQQAFHIEGMHCDACVNRVNKALAALAQHVQVTLDPPQARLQVAAPLALETVQAALQKAGDYRASAA
jgi:copper chaperone CopZ